MGNYNKNLFKKFMSGIAVVHVKTQDECVEFMKLLERETSLKWPMGKKPTYFDIWTLHEEKTCISRVVGRYMIRYSGISYYDSKGYEIIEFSDLMKKENNMKFKAGDKVRVRSWKRMAKEFGLDQYGNIDCSAHFIHSMKKYCGTIQTIGSVDSDRYFLVQKNSEDIYCWVFTDDMLEPVKEPTKGEHFRKELKALKSNGCKVAIVDGKPTKCDWKIPCYACLFHDGDDCLKSLKKWCAEPYEAQEDKPILDKV